MSPPPPARRRGWWCRALGADQDAVRLERSRCRNRAGGSCRGSRALVLALSPSPRRAPERRGPRAQIGPRRPSGRLRTGLRPGQRWRLRPAVCRSGCPRRLRRRWRRHRPTSVCRAGVPPRKRRRLPRVGVCACECAGVWVSRPAIGFNAHPPAPHTRTPAHPHSYTHPHHSTTPPFHHSTTPSPALSTRAAISQQPVAPQSPCSRVDSRSSNRDSILEPRHCVSV